MRCEGSVAIDLEKVPRIEMEILGRAIYKAAEDFFNDPANEAEFRKWLENRRNACVLV